MNLLIIGIILAVAFLVQSILGYLQIKDFARTFHSMNKNGKVLIGKNPKKLRAGSLILLNIDESANIFDAKKMMGITIFARFKDFSELKGKSLPELAASHDELIKFDALTRQCILNAYRNYVNFKSGKMSRTDMDTTTVNFLSLPVFKMLINNAKFKIHNFIEKSKNKSTKEG